MDDKFLTLFAELLEMNENMPALNDVFRDYDEWNSLAYLSLIAMIDEEYDVQIEGNEFKNLITVGDIIDAIKIKSYKNAI
jgi:acyl carrier protein